ncbi:hypothetical protein KAK07_02050 [Ideonella sp. 4Y16]|uniref:GH36-type glycosyl hydrolase domain-containing protein n=1 Tax=Ideonella alba TaxID=2824118 RepID=UPI001B387363|nr:hypothetical protein [Ideonella alba]MBQ0942111.1 hypothetical protein [Ideonella alba]
MSAPICTDLRVTSPAGLDGLFTAHGSLRRLQARGLSINQHAASAHEAGPHGLWLRRLSSTGPQAVPLLGPRSPSTVHADALGLHAQGRWEALAWRVHLVPSATDTAWFWHVELHNEGPDTLQLDALHALDPGLAPWGAVRTNEYYVSHYLDHQPLTHPRHGTVLATRQNLAVEGRHPWLLLGSLRRCVAWATDGLQWWGRGADDNADGDAAALRQGLPAQRLQHEHALLALQDEALTLPPGARAQLGFFALLLADHPAASGPADLAWVDTVTAMAEAHCPPAPPAWPATAAAPRSLFCSAPALACHAPDDATLQAWVPGERRHEERNAEGRLLSAFVGAQHLVTPAKARQVLRPHGHLLRSGDALEPDESALTSTCWMGGVFHSMVTQGHVGINRWLGTVRGYLGQFRSQGLRLFVETAGGWRLLDQPSAFAMTPDSARWWYRHDGGLIEVRAGLQHRPHALTLDWRVAEGAPLRVLLALQVAIDGDDGVDATTPRWARDGHALHVFTRPGTPLGERFPLGRFTLRATPGTVLEAIDDDRLLFDSGRPQGTPWLALRCAPARAGGCTLHGGLVEAAPPAAAALPPSPLAEVTAPPGQDLPQRLATILPWFQHNALVHFLAPRGLEQFSGGGWGTRDVCQGPVELLLALQHTGPVRTLLRQVFSAQDRSGDWPQWFMFFEREREIRAGDSHGDIVYWPLLALGQYLIASGDFALLDEPLPYHQDGPPETLWQHAQRALAITEARVLPGTLLAAYGHGDWNDALQPADPALREHLCSSWTVTLHHQVLSTLSCALQQAGRPEAAALAERAQAVREAFRQHLIADGQIAGYLLRPPGQPPEWLLHPRDTRTGVRHSLLPMMHAILNDLLTPEEARHHVALIRQHLMGPDGARLFDAPLPYRGGPQTLFQRAESSSYFGREIGLMYTHAHLRWAEALAHLGDADGFAEALGLATPVDLHRRLPQGAPRQANCYYSSSDALFSDRYEAQDHYERIARGEVPLEGGWRVYSSGAGIALSLVIRQFLGIRLEHDAVVIDPVMPAAMDALEVTLTLNGQRWSVRYRVGAQGCGVRGVTVEGHALAFRRRPHGYRAGAVSIDRAVWSEAAPAGTPVAVEIVIG